MVMNFSILLKKPVCAGLSLLLLSTAFSSAQAYKSNPASAADAEIERQKILRAADSIEEMRAVVDGLNNQISDLKKEIQQLQ